MFKPQIYQEKNQDKNLKTKPGNLFLGSDFSKHPWNTAWLFGGRNGPRLKAANKGKDLDPNRGGAGAARGLAAFSFIPTAFLVNSSVLSESSWDTPESRASRAAGQERLLLTYKTHDSSPPRPSFQPLHFFVLLWGAQMRHCAVTKVLPGSLQMLMSRSQLVLAHKG